MSGSSAKKKSLEIEETDLKRQTDSSALTHCEHCNTGLDKDDRALFVEEEHGKIFCSEDCIIKNYGNEIEKLEKRFYDHLSSDDLDGEKREELAYLRWENLTQPQTVWKNQEDKSEAPQYTLISEFQIDGQSVWSVCVTLMLRNEPSFLFLAFVTRDPELVHVFERGEEVDPTPFQHKTDEKGEYRSGEDPHLPPEEEGEKDPGFDGLADSWTVDDTFRADLKNKRTSGDVPRESFESYEDCIEDTLQFPDEVWKVSVGTEEDDPEPVVLYHFIRKHDATDDHGAFWYIVVGREMEGAEQVELLDSFPSIDEALVNQYRQGELQVTSEAGPELDDEFTDDIEIETEERTVH
ncbi:MAG: hypothetical protein CL678_06595 [Bdellovibrionaceae bacterium]|nr:hypothetical protein [Pseudobdellovibrionaceae bacterium]|tara:strand:+ start:2817 stop:3869 length:1053 start_codon:yes stop_codon:yes gene_type:complete